MVDRVYRWEGRRPGRKTHILNPATGKTWCQLENMQRKRALDSEGTALPPSRQTCKNCRDLAERGVADYREPSLAVLMGERLDEEGLGHAADASEGAGLFDTAPKPRERERLPRVVRCPEGRKPKRSKVKHARPFDDPLPPWL